MPNEVFRINMGELREKFLSAHRNYGRLDGVSINASSVAHYSTIPSDNWTGGGASDFANYFENGFMPSHVPEFDTSVIPIRKKKRSRYNDCEGDFRYDLYTAGDENCFVEWTRRESIPGLHIQFFFGFLAKVPAEVITQYTDWLLGAFTTLESAGVDCSISVFNRARKRYLRSIGSEEIAEFHIEVKRESERNDYTFWSALFAPGAYRILGFFTVCLMAEFNKRQVNPSMGASLGKDWGVTFNPETRVIEISAYSLADDFPEERMTRELAAAIEASRVS
jgi:hypothetical protein